MVYVRIVLMAMTHGNVGVRVRVGFGAVPGEIVVVAGMLVMRVRGVVRERVMTMQVPMALGEMQGHAGRDQCRGEPEKRIRDLAEQNKRRRRTDEGRGREVGTGSRRAEEPKRHDEQGKTYSVAEKADDRRGQCGLQRRPSPAERDRG